MMHLPPWPVTLACLALSVVIYTGIWVIVSAIITEIVR